MKFTKLKRTYLEIIFKSHSELYHYITARISLLGQTHMGYYALTDNRIFLNITMKNVPITELSTISNAIKNYFKNICPITFIKLLVYAGTKFLSDQWQISLDITDKEKITKIISRYIKLLGDKVILFWKNTPSFCLFCEREEYFRKDCPTLREVREGKLSLEKLNEIIIIPENESNSKNKSELQNNEIIDDKNNNPFIFLETSFTKEKEPIQTISIEEENDLFSPSDNNSDISIPDVTTNLSLTNISEDEKMTDTILPDLEPIITPPPAKHTLGKRIDHPSTSSETIKRGNQKRANKKKKKGGSSSQS